jgi:hypothetical protein
VLLTLIDLLWPGPFPLSGFDDRSLILDRCIELIESKSGGSSGLDDEAANVTASGPYGTLNRLNVSLEERNLTCSDVGPVRGKANSVRVAVWVRGGEIELRDIIEGEVSGPSSGFFDTGLEKRVNIEPALEPAR